MTQDMYPTIDFFVCEDGKPKMIEKTMESMFT
jgi:hypothetical protein